MDSKDLLKSSIVPKPNKTIPVHHTDTFQKSESVLREALAKEEIVKNKTTYLE